MKLKIKNISETKTKTIKINQNENHTALITNTNYAMKEVMYTRRMAIANWTCVRWVAYAPGTIAVNVMDQKRIQCLSNTLHHVPIYLQPFLTYSEISVASDCFLTVFVSEWAFFLPHFAFAWVRPWDNRGKCHTVGKRIQCLSNTS